MITFEQAQTAREFHKDGCTRTVGPRGGVTITIVAYRRNGKTQTWKTRPGSFRIPCKYGMYSYLSIDNVNAADFHTEEECPINGDN